MAIRLAFVGVGGIARRHLATAAVDPRCELAAVCDVDLDRARQTGEAHGVPAFADCREMYERVRPDAAVVCVPPFAHGEIEVEAAARGIHLFIEKPVALSMDSAERVLEAVRGAGIVTQVGYMYRLCRTVARVRELLDGRIIAMAQLHYFAGGMPAKAWWPRMDGSGGQLIEQATHMIDLGRFLVGEVESVAAMTANVRDWTPPEGWVGPESWQTHYVPDLAIPDTSALLLHYASGALGTLSCCMMPQATWSNGLTVVAEGLRASIAGPVPDARWETLDGAGEMAAEDGWSSHVLSEFIGALAGECAASIPYEEGVRSLAVSLAGYASARRGGRPVAVAEMLPRDLQG
ncbi:MAG: Gfo/Idh/MocA family protein [Armatimonadota bacterium]